MPRSMKRPKKRLSAWFTRRACTQALPTPARPWPVSSSESSARKTRRKSKAGWKRRSASSETTPAFTARTTMTRLSTLRTAFRAPGSYLSEAAGIAEGEAIAYLIAPPAEAIVALDAAMKAADVQMCLFYGPPTETNFAGGLLTGDQAACKAAWRGLCRHGLQGRGAAGYHLRKTFLHNF